MISKGKYDTGTSTRIEGLYRSVKKINSQTICVNIQRRQDAKNLPRLLNLLLQFKRGYRINRQMRDRQKTTRYDIIQTRIFNLPYIISLKALNGTKIIGDIHALSSLETTSPLERKFWEIIEQMSCILLDAIIVPTPELEGFIKKKYRKMQVYTIPNPVSLGKNLESQEKNCETILFYHGTPYSENVKGLRRFVKICDQLNENGDKTRGLIAGNFPELVKSPNVEYLGYVENLGECIEKADIGVLPVNPVSLGIRSRALEYLKHGLPIVTTPEGACGLEAVVRENIVKVCQSDSEMITEIKNLITSYPEKEKIRELLKNNYSTQLIGDKLNFIYKSVTNKNNRILNTKM